MKKSKLQGAAALVLATLLAIGSGAGLTVSAKAYPDVKSGDWFYNAVDRWSGDAYAVLVGDENGDFRPNAPMTVGELSVVLSKALGYSQSAELSAAKMAKPNAEYFAKAVAAGVVDKNADPSKQLTREESIKNIALAFGVEPLRGKPSFVDQNNISAAYLGYVNAFLEAGYISPQGMGGGKFEPKSYFTRAQIMQVLDNMLADITDASVAGKTYNGSLIVRQDKTTLKNVTVKGDLIIGQGVGDGEVTLDNVKVSGRLIAYGGGSHSIIIKGASQITTVVANKTFGEPVRVVSANPNMRLKSFEVKPNSKALVSVPVLELRVDANATVEIAEGAVVQGVIVDGDKVTITVDKDGVIEHITIDGSGVTVSGGGEVRDVDFGAGGSGSVNTATGTKISNIVSENYGSSSSYDGGGYVPTPSASPAPTNPPSGGSSDSAAFAYRVGLFWPESGAASLILVNGVETTMSAPMEIVNGNAYVPIAALAAVFGAGSNDISYSAVAQTLVVRLNGMAVTWTAGSSNYTAPNGALVGMPDGCVATIIHEQLYISVLSFATAFNIPVIFDSEALMWTLNPNYTPPPVTCVVTTEAELRAVNSLPNVNVVIANSFQLVGGYVSVYGDVTVNEGVTLELSLTSLFVSGSMTINGTVKMIDARASLLLTGDALTINGALRGGGTGSYAIDFGTHTVVRGGSADVTDSEMGMPYAATSFVWDYAAGIWRARSFSCNTFDELKTIAALIAAIGPMPAGYNRSIQVSSGVNPSVLEPFYFAESLTLPARTSLFISRKTCTVAPGASLSLGDLYLSNSTFDVTGGLNLTLLQLDESTLNVTGDFTLPGRAMVGINGAKTSVLSVSGAVSVDATYGSELRCRSFADNLSGSGFDALKAAVSAKPYKVDSVNWRDGGTITARTATVTNAVEFQAAFTDNVNSINISGVVTLPSLTLSGYQSFGVSNTNYEAGDKLVIGDLTIGANSRFSLAILEVEVTGTLITSRCVRFPFADIPSFRLNDKGKGLLFSSNTASLKGLLGVSPYPLPSGDVM